MFLSSPGKCNFLKCCSVALRSVNSRNSPVYVLFVPNETFVCKIW